RIRQGRATDRRDFRWAVPRSSSTAQKYDFPFMALTFAACCSKISGTSFPRLAISRSAQASEESATSISCRMPWALAFDTGRRSVLCALTSLTISTPRNTTDSPAIIRSWCSAQLRARVPLPRSTSAIFNFSFRLGRLSDASAADWYGVGFRGDGCSGVSGDCGSVGNHGREQSDYGQRYHSTRQACSLSERADARFDPGVAKGDGAASDRSEAGGTGDGCGQLCE